MHAADGRGSRVVAGRRGRDLVAAQGRRGSRSRRPRWGDARSTLAVQDRPRAWIRPRLVHELQPRRRGVQRADHAVGVGDAPRPPIPEPETSARTADETRAVLRPLRDRREPHRRHTERRRRLTARDRPAGSARRVGCRTGAGAAGSVPLPGGPCRTASSARHRRTAAAPASSCATSPVA